MQAGDDRDVTSEPSGNVIPFPVDRATPPPLPPLPRSFPTPGAGQRSSPLFGAALTVRFDRQAA